MKTIIFKKPQFQDDSFYVRLQNVNRDFLNNVCNYYDKTHVNSKYNDEDFSYFKIKRQMFMNYSTQPSKLYDFENRPSLRNIKYIDKLDSTIYTVAVQKNNNIPYQNLIFILRNFYKKYGKNRRLLLRFANPIETYIDSVEDVSIDVTCLSLIHYFGNTIKLIFRASDIKNQLLFDILNIYEFFIEPVIPHSNFNIQIFASTSQNINHFNELFNIKIKDLVEDLNEIKFQ